MILVVDDDELVVRCVRIMLEGRGHEVITASNGREALALLESGVKPALVLLDLVMPHMGGNEFLDEMSRSGRKVPVVVMSAYLDELRDEFKTSVAGVIQKLPPPEKLIEAVERWAGRPPGDQSKMNE